ncbi:MAG: hypothetical protein Q3994_04730 [Prevotella sp.]|nr:hypothetical protein [Prevotella sp.]
MHGLDTYDYGARQYDPARITWDRMTSYVRNTIISIRMCIVLETL